jgi:hypothetical protein
LGDITATREKFTKALNVYLSGSLAPLKKLLDGLATKKTFAETALWSLPADAPHGFQPLPNKFPQLELTGLNIKTNNKPVFIEVQATSQKYDIARVAWATDGEFRAGEEREMTVGYPSGEALPTYRIPVQPTGNAITGFRLTFPLNTQPELKALKVREISAKP